jgi:hypothetical protein
MGINNIFDPILIHDDFSTNFLSDIIENCGICIEPSHGKGQFVRSLVRDTGLFHIADCFLKMSLTAAVGSPVCGLSLHRRGNELFARSNVTDDVRGLFLGR